MEILKTDVLVIGGGLAALRAARESGARVLLICKKAAITRAGNTSRASGGFAAANRDPDSIGAHLDDIMTGGRGINDRSLAGLIGRLICGI